ncbi:response regulator transcription factor [Paucihalobacter ruber]|uniref:Response regulator transcription factor n=1 Tax=Paucihalobacter ruber TaxID=2567861 RepID=A0A506PHX9_9FLAO|nr:response regulator transcription factor [Paucihalobacter ruber]TPV33421.1 response regulator transcription factor [Paucihalobacter ruber]
MEKQIEIILVDDEALFRSGIKFILEREPNLKVVFEASNGNELLNYLKRAKRLPDIILMDLKMPMLNGVETTKILNTLYPQLKVIALSSYDTRSFIINMINEGVSSYIIKNSTPQEMIETINKVHQKGFYYNKLTLKIINDEKKNKSNTAVKSVLDPDFLTNREYQILEHICLEFNTQEIAEKLSISPRTIEVHRNNLMEKTKSKNVAGLVVFALQNDLISIETLLKMS